MTANKLHRHFILFKPYGFLSQFETNARHEVHKKFLGSLYDFPENIMAIGRLDKDSEGLLLLTTDGKVSDFINSNKVDKEYYAQVDGIITDDAILKMKTGLSISIEGENYITKPCKVKRLISIPSLPDRAKKIRADRHGPTSWISIILNEGKFHQVRKMTAAVGYPTLRLVRVRVATLNIKEMKAGQVREVDEFIL
jgi:23S rRNA pseudouridine2457 synthase